MSEDRPDELQAIVDKIDLAIAQISEHCDAVQIFATKRRDDGPDGTIHIAKGAGNWFARYGHVKAWVIQEESDIAIPPE